MQSRHGRGCRFKLSLELDSPGLQSRHLVLHRGTRNARLDCLDHSANITFGLLQVACGSVAISILVGPLPVYFLVELVDEGRDQFWVHQLIPEASQFVLNSSLIITALAYRTSRGCFCSEFRLGAVHRCGDFFCVS